MNLEIIKSLNKQKAINALDIICGNISILKEQEKQKIQIDLNSILKQSKIYQENLNTKELTLNEIDEILSYIDIIHIKIIKSI